MAVYTCNTIQFIYAYRGVAKLITYQAVLFIKVELNYVGEEMGSLIYIFNV